MSKLSFYITSPIFYPNADLHLGHAYSVLVCDVLARYHRLLDVPTFFLTGTDDNASKVARAAQKENLDPKEFVDEKSSRFKSLYKELNVQYDDFIQTSDREKHWPGAIAIWNKLAEKGDIYKKAYRGLYCVGCESFKSERDLVDGKCPLHDLAPEIVEEENYFFKLSAYNEQLKKLIENDTLQIVPSTRKNEILSLINQGLEDVSFSRPADKVFGWGIPVPGDETQIMYVWCDALVNYISALGYGSSDTEKFEKFWPANVHVVGKDILRFHAAIWPAMLLSVGIEIPQAVLAHGFINFSGRKMSKTIGNTISPEELVSKYGTDAVRYFLIREINPFEDSEFLTERFEESYNAHLANGLGNLTSRIMKMAEDNLSAPINTPDFVFPKNYREAFEEFNIQKVAHIVWEHIGITDRKIQETEPFKLVKQDPEGASKIISELVIDLYKIGRMIEPLLPETSKKILEAVQKNKKPEQSLFNRI